MYECPYCNEPGLTLLQKMTLGPARAKKCRQCRQEVTVPWGSFVLMLPFVVSLLLARALPFGWGFAAVTVGVVIMFGGWHFVPLVKR